MSRCRLLLLALATFAFSSATLAVSEDDVFGMFERISPPVATKSKDKVEVVEIFWYRCPHCFRFQPAMIQYESTAPDYVDFKRMPAVVSERWKPAAKAAGRLCSLGADGRFLI